MMTPPPTAIPDGPDARERTRLGRCIVIAAVLVVVGVAGAGIRLATKTTTTSSQLAATTAPPVVGRTATGRHFDLSAERGKWVLVNFFASWCTDCRRELTQLTALQQRHPSGLSVVSVDGADDSLPAAEKLIRAARGSWPLVNDPTASIAYNIVGLPESFLLNPRGEIVDRIIGPLTQADVTTALDGEHGAAH